MAVEIFIHRVNVEERMTVSFEIFQLFRSTLGQNCVAGIAVVC